MPSYYKIKLEEVGDYSVFVNKSFEGCHRIDLAINHRKELHSFNFLPTSKGTIIYFDSKVGDTLIEGKMYAMRGLTKEEVVEEILCELIEKWKGKSIDDFLRDFI